MSSFRFFPRLTVILDTRLRDLCEGLAITITISLWTIPQGIHKTLLTSLLRPINTEGQVMFRYWATCDEMIAYNSNEKGSGHESHVITWTAWYISGEQWNTVISIPFVHDKSHIYKLKTASNMLLFKSDPWVDLGWGSNQWSLSYKTDDLTIFPWSAARD